MSKENRNSVKDVTPSIALSMIRKGALLVDVRETREIERKAFDVSDFMSVPMSSFQSQLHEIPANRKVIIACHSGNRSSMASRILVNHGYKNVHNLQNGIIRWEREGLPIRKKTAESPFAWMGKMFRRTS
jgi:rhodanese-related sulfurtransferase